MKPNQWEDHFARQARKEKYPARSVYKLREMQEKYRIMATGDKILDLGCAPGSWLLYAARQAGRAGRVIGIDKKPLSIAVPANVTTYTGDVLNLDEELLQTIGHDFRVTLSDMAPDTTGNKKVDADRSFVLCEAALLLAQKVLQPGGSFVCKIFQGQDFNLFLNLVKSTFKRCRIFKPRSSRKKSREIYIIGLGMK